MMFQFTVDKMLLHFLFQPLLAKFNPFESESSNDNGAFT